MDEELYQYLTKEEMEELFSLKKRVMDIEFEEINEVKNLIAMLAEKRDLLIQIATHLKIQEANIENLAYNRKTEAEKKQAQRQKIRVCE